MHLIPRRRRTVIATALLALAGSGFGACRYLASRPFDHRAIVADVEKRFASFAGPAAPAPEPAHFRGGTRVETRDLEQVHIAMALQGVPVRDEQLYSLQVFTSVLGGGMSS